MMWSWARHRQQQRYHRWRYHHRWKLTPKTTAMTTPQLGRDYPFDRRIISLPLPQSQQLLPSLLLLRLFPTTSLPAAATTKTLARHGVSKLVAHRHLLLLPLLPTLSKIMKSPLQKNGCVNPVVRGGTYPRWPSLVTIVEERVIIHDSAMINC